MDRTIEVKVCGNHLSKDNKNAGVRGEANVTKLRISFDEGWNGYAKTVTFWDARGANPVKVVLGQTLQEDMTDSNSAYIVPIPQEPLAEAGMLTFVIDGYIPGLIGGQIQRSLSDRLEVKDAPIADGAVEPADPTPSPELQLQSEIEALRDHLSDAIRAKEAIRNMSVTSETLSAGEEVTVQKAEYDGVVNLHFGIPEGEKGDTGDSGVHIGEEEPTDPTKNVWIDPKGSTAGVSRASFISGKNAYEIAVDQGFDGTVEEWLESLKGDDYILTPSDKEEIAEIVRGEIHTEKEITLTATGWTGTAAPYQQTVYVAGITASTQGTVYVADTATDAQYSAAVYAVLRKTAQGADSVTIKAYGEKPTVDIPITVRIGG